LPVYDARCFFIGLEVLSDRRIVASALCAGHSGWPGPLENKNYVEKILNFRPTPKSSVKINRIRKKLLKIFFTNLPIKKLLKKALFWTQLVQKQRVDFILHFLSYLTS
jgi:hypothetical protein